MRPRGSQAREAFAEALAVIAGSRSADPAVRPAFEVPTGDGGGGGLHAAPPAAAWDALSWPSLSGLPDAEGGVPRRPEDDGILATARLLRSGAETARGLLERSLDAVATHDPRLNAVAELMADQARAAADAADAEMAAGRWRGPLHGIPVTVKDVIDVVGVPTRGGSLAYEAVPERDAAAVARMRDGGAVILAKVTTHEFALGVTSPQSRNPRDPARIPGGSSGGSAIAVATGMGLVSIGTDTRASLRVPAALSGVVGFKPTYGRVTTAGVLPLSWTMDHVGPITTSVADAAVVLDVLTGHGRLSESLGTDPSGLRIGVPPATLEGCDDAVAAAFEAAVASLASLGHRVLPAPQPDADNLRASNAAGLLVSRCEAATLHRAMGLDRSLYWEEVADQLDLADRVSAIDYIDAQRLRSRLTATLTAVFEDVDVLATPTTPVVAPPAHDFARFLLLLSRNAVPWSLVGFPAVSLPLPPGPGGLPIGLQLVAAPGRESVLVALGDSIERARRRG